MEITVNRNGNNARFGIAGKLDKRERIRKGIIRAGFAKYAYYGVNGSRLEVKGIFERTIKVNRSPVKIKFFVVPNSTMLFAMTLGCDYILAAN